MPRKRSIWVMLSTICVVITALLVSQPWHAQAEQIADSNAVDTDADDDDDVSADRDDDFDDDDFDEDEERDREDRDFESEEDEREWMEEELEIEYLELETLMSIANIAESEVGSAALALTHLDGLFDEEGPAALTTFLSDALNEADNPGIKRLLRFKLAELHFDQDQPDQARSQLRHLLTGK